MFFVVRHETRKLELGECWEEFIMFLAANHIVIHETFNLMSGVRDLWMGLLTCRCVYFVVGYILNVYF
jgi:hypothetical protein